MSALTSPDSGEFIIVPPNNSEVNQYLEVKPIYDAAEKHGFADESKAPELYATINRKRVFVGVSVLSDGLLCAYVLPWSGKGDDELGRLYFALTSRGSGSARRWTLHPTQLITRTDGDKHMLARNGPETIMRQILSQRQP